jgi:hypothetical protein
MLQTISFDVNTALTECSIYILGPPDLKTVFWAIPGRSIKDVLIPGIHQKPRFSFPKFPRPIFGQLNHFPEWLNMVNYPKTIKIAHLSTF